VPDHAVSDHPAVQRQLARLGTLSPGADTLGLERIGELVARLGHPERSLPPVFHVAGTNGKGSTCAFLRAAIEAAGLTVHAYTSPHLVRFNERIRLGGTLITDDDLAALLEEVLAVAEGIGPSFFEATTAAALLAFSRVPADACIVEVGLGGRLDATNIIPAPAVTGIAQLGLDHQAFLGSRIEGIAAEKAGIAKPGIPLLTQAYPDRVAEQIARVATAAGAIWLPRGQAWDAVIAKDRLAYRDGSGAIDLPLPSLAGAHQAENAALAVAMLRHQNAVRVGTPALRAAMGWAEWPARLQRLEPGPLASLLPQGSELWLDGGHNPAAARAIADHFHTHVPPMRPFHMILGMLANKDAAGVLKPFAGRAITLHGVPVENHEHHAPAALTREARENGLSARVAESVQEALSWIARHADQWQPPIVLVMGSLYLAGEVLRENEQLPA
jgi:dihydrofolate synthase/folylpolyglutamate synthase